MIVISGALVLVALILLVIGVVGPDLTFVYASIVVSLVSLVFLVIGILQRRGETAPAAETAEPVAPERVEEAEGVTAVIPAQASSRKTAEPRDVPPVEDTADEELEVGGRVLVVAGRPRYHVEGCRYLSGKSADEVDVREAREEGFSPCGVCKPDEALAVQEPAAEPAEDTAPTAAAAEDGAPVVQEDVPGVDVPPKRRSAAGGARAVTPPAPKKSATARVAARKAPAPPVEPAEASEAAEASEVAVPPAEPAETAVPTRAASKAPAKGTKGVKAVKAVKAPGRAATAAAAGSPAAAAANRPGSVVVMPDRGKFHRAECRFVRDAEEADVLTRTAAGRQGYTACGVCKP